MVALKPDTQVLLDGAVKVYKRGNSRLWQATFKIDKHWVRISTGKQDLEEGKAATRDQYLEYRFPNIFLLELTKPEQSWRTKAIANRRYITL